MILIISSDNIPHIGGKSTHILDLIDGLKRNAIECKLFSQKQYGQKKLNWIRYMLAPIYVLNRDLYVYLYFEIWAKILSKKVLGILKENDVEAISVQDAFAAYAISKIKTHINCPVTLTMHTYFGLENALDKEKINFLTNKIYDIRLKHELISLKTVDSIVAVDDRIKKSVDKEIQKIKQSDVTCKECLSIQNFTNIDQFCPVKSSSEKKELRKKYNISTSAFVIVCARRLVEKNGVEFAVKAMSLVKKKEALLIIAGNGPQYSNIERMIEQNALEEKVKLIDSVPTSEMASIYNLSDIAVVPSITVNGLQEATSISALESMSCGLPTIASSIGGLKEMIVDKSNGILTEERNSQDIADAIDLLGTDKELYKKIATESRAFVEKTHSHLVTSMKYYDIFTNRKSLK